MMRSKSERPKIDIEGNERLVLGKGPVVGKGESTWRDRYIVAHSLSCFTLLSSSSASVTCRGCWDAGSGTLLPLLEEDSIASLVLLGGGTLINLFWPFNCLRMGWTCTNAIKTCNFMTIIHPFFLKKKRKGTTRHELEPVLPTTALFGSLLFNGETRQVQKNAPLHL